MAKLRGSTCTLRSAARPFRSAFLPEGVVGTGEERRKLLARFRGEQFGTFGSFRETGERGGEK